MTRRHNLTGDEKTRIIEMRESGRTYAQIAQAIGCVVGSVSWYCLQEGVEKPGAKYTAPINPPPSIYLRRGRTVRLFSADDDRQLLDLESQGLSLNEIGTRMGRRHNSIIGRLRTLARRDERLTTHPRPGLQGHLSLPHTGED